MRRIPPPVVVNGFMCPHFEVFVRQIAWYVPAKILQCGLDSVKVRPVVYADTFQLLMLIVCFLSLLDGPSISPLGTNMMPRVVDNILILPRVFTDTS